MIFGGYIDVDAQSFVQAAGITDRNQILAVARLVADLKGKYNRNYPTSNIWNKFYTIYPFVGANSGSHAVNLKQPGTFNLTYSGSGTHSATGFSADGTSSYADTNLYVRTTPVLNDFHLSTYIRENKYTELDQNGSGFLGTYLAFKANIIGAYLDIAGDYSTSSVNLFWAAQQNTLNTTGSIQSIQNITGRPLEIKGYHVVSRSTSSYFDIYYNGNFLITGSDVSTATAGVDIPFKIGGGGTFSPPLLIPSSREQAFVSIGYALNATESRALYNAVQNYQTLLNRQV